MAAALMGLLLGANAGAVDLTAKNFDKEVLESGKSAFVKFLAPWYVRRPPRAFSIVLPRRSTRIPRVRARSQPPLAATRLETRGLTPARSSTGLGNIPAPAIQHPAASPGNERSAQFRASKPPIGEERNFFFNPTAAAESLTSPPSPLSSSHRQVRPLQVDEARLG